MERNGQVSERPDRARDLNNRYRNFKIIEKSMRGRGQDTCTASSRRRAGRRGEAVGEHHRLGASRAATSMSWQGRRRDGADQEQRHAGRSLTGAASRHRDGCRTDAERPRGRPGTIGGAVPPLRRRAPAVEPGPVRTSIVNRATGVDVPPRCRINAADQRPATNVGIPMQPYRRAGAGRVKSRCRPRSRCRCRRPLPIERRRVPAAPASPAPAAPAFQHRSGPGARSAQRARHAGADPRRGNAGAARRPHTAGEGVMAYPYRLAGGAAARPDSLNFDPALQQGADRPL